MIAILIVAPYAAAHKSASWFQLRDGYLLPDGRYLIFLAVSGGCYWPVFAKMAPSVSLICLHLVWANHAHKLDEALPSDRLENGHLMAPRLFIAGKHRQPLHQLVLIRVWPPSPQFRA